MIVLDASAATELVLRTPTAARLAARIGEHVIHAPHIIDLEVCSALRALEKSRAIASADADLALTKFQDLQVVRVAPSLLVDRIWALRGKLTPYDASYIALAEALHAPVITCDGKLARTAGHSAAIEVLS
ncbi:MAG TPA: type II toxin-antitoxin system VapC family toxin [Kofleriaceae bacterium]|nr:type II toxin-antitoxin system VapC family toxin [Kofleriaceae bacterium]